MRILRKIDSLFSRWSQQNILLPHLPKCPREIAGDLLYTLLRLTARYGLVVAGIWGWLSFGLPGMVASVFVGVIIDFSIRYSLGLRSGNVMQAFRIRSVERAFGNKRKLLEAVVEGLRGNPLTPAKCAEIAGAYKTAESHVAASDSDDERKRLREQLEEHIHRIVYRPRPNPTLPAGETTVVEEGAAYRPADV